MEFREEGEKKRPEKFLPAARFAQELLSCLMHLARRQGLPGFTAPVLVENRAMLHVFEKCGFERNKQMIQGVDVLSMMFEEGARDTPWKMRSRGRTPD